MFDTKSSTVKSMSPNHQCQRNTPNQEQINYRHYLLFTYDII